LQSILDTMLAKDPAERYQTPAAAAEALHVFMNTGANHEVTPESDPKMTSFLCWLDEKSAAAPTTSMPSLSLPTPSDELEESFGPIPAPKKRFTKGTTPALSPGPAPIPPAAPPSSAGTTKVRSKPSVRTASKASVPKISAGDVKPVLPQISASNALTRRDFLMMGIGAGSVMGAILLGWGLSHLLQTKPADNK
jgi:hypothetical protein